MTAVLYDAQEYMIAGLDNQAEWWEHPGDACHLYRRPEMALLYDSLGVRCPHAGAREEVTRRDTRAGPGDQRRLP